jgi:hypothetical protein
VGLLGPCGAFTESCRSLTFPLSPAGTPESKSFSPDVLSIYRQVDIAAYRDRSGFDRLVRGPGFVLVVSRQDDALIQSYSDLHNASAPFRLLPIRAPTSGKLRISFWLAPSFGHRPTFDRPVKKTRDVSNRLLPLIRTTCTRTSCVPDSLRELLRVDVPQRLRLRTT